MPGLELIAQTGNHAYHVDLAAATHAGVLVGMGSSDMDAMSDIAASTVELTFALMLALLRRIPQTDRAIRDGQWPSVLGHTMCGKRLGILGLGRIGREVARIALGVRDGGAGVGTHADAARAADAGASAWSSTRCSKLRTSSPSI